MKNKIEQMSLKKVTTLEKTTKALFIASIATLSTAVASIASQIILNKHGVWGNGYAYHFSGLVAKLSGIGAGTFGILNSYLKDVKNEKRDIEISNKEFGLNTQKFLEKVDIQK